MTYDIIKGHKRTGLYPLSLSKKHIFGKPQAAGIQRYLCVDYFLQVSFRGVFRDISDIK